MYRFDILNTDKAHQYEELIKVFLKPDDFVIAMENPDRNCSNTVTLSEAANLNICDEHIFRAEFSEDRDMLRKDIFMFLKEKTGNEPPWGTMTGIRPVKLFGEIAEKEGEDVASNIFSNVYCVSSAKTELARKIYKYQKETLKNSMEKGIGLYIGIPFCPTRCLYCSFTSNQVEESEMDRYMEALLYEISAVSELMKKSGMYAETIYIGGGTPTTLSEKNLDLLLDAINRNLISSNLLEYTVEAGRPDTLTDRKLDIIKRHNVGRISINPQTMNDSTLKTIGRNHTEKQIRDAVIMARKVGISSINCDLIVGLPGENMQHFKDTLDKVHLMNPDNITVHTLSVKRSSRLVDIDKDYHYKQGEIATEMMEYAYEFLEKKGYLPYYLYRQKHMAGAGENVGFCKKNHEGIYNIRIMDEHQSILALGAGGISKLYYPDQNRLERVANVSNYSVYIDRIDEMIERKKLNFFKEVCDKC